MTDVRRAHDMDEVSQCLQELDAYGYTHIRDFLSPERVGELRVLVEQHHAEANGEAYAGKPARDVLDGFVYNLQNKDKRFVDLLGDPVLTEILKAKLNDPYYRFMPPENPNYILGYYNARSSGTLLDLHIDSFVPSPGDWTWSVQIGIPLVDQTRENGCTTIVPGSHRSGRYSDRDMEKVHPIESSAGDLVIWDSRLWHGTLENRSGASRWALVATFTMWWVKQTMDIPRALPQHIYEELDDAQKALLGFCAIAPRDEHDRVNTKTGYDALMPKVTDYHR